ncbi:hypothetical protein M0811_04341 [Anaeramoeba ignava]|uniref:Uncharacterized protein n=1 Tax=Anaeramoeba ignava TaxID=1746090 RepID=A0A9Q0LWS7_ANAIG|nr:hypothetical protein M0811_04341 [Anaeramoeba ignava]
MQSNRKKDLFTKAIKKLDKDSERKPLENPLNKKEKKEKNKTEIKEDWNWYIHKVYVPEVICFYKNDLIGKNQTFFRTNIHSKFPELNKLKKWIACYIQQEFFDCIEGEDNSYKNKLFVPDYWKVGISSLVQDAHDSLHATQKQIALENLDDFQYVNTLPLFRNTFSILDVYNEGGSDLRN